MDKDPKDFTAAREWLQSTLEGSAEWRARKAEEYPDDQRNASSAAALAQAAQDVAAMADDDPRLSSLGRLYEISDDEAMSDYATEENLHISRHGFDNPAATTDELLGALGQAADRATIDSLDARLSEE